MLWPYCINCITAAILNCQDMLFIRSCAYRDWMVVPLVRWFWSYHHCSHLHSFFPNLICSIWRVSSPVPFTFQIFIFYPLYLIFFYQLNMNGTLTSISWYIYHYTILIFIVEFEGGLLRSHYLFHLFPPLPYLFVIFSFWRGTLASYLYVICRILRGTQEVLFTLSTRECLHRSTFLSIATYFLVLILNDI